MKKNQLKTILSKEADTLVNYRLEEIKQNVKINIIADEKPKLSSNRYSVRAMLAYLSLIVVICASLIIVVISKQEMMISNTFITIDINPSIELQANPNGKVIGVNGLNRDAIIILEDLSIDLIDQDLVVACLEIIKLAQKNHYLDVNQTSNDIMISSVNDNLKYEIKILELITNNIKEYFNNQGLKGNVTNNLSQKNNQHLQREAKKLGLSVGKLQLIKEVCEKHPEITFEEAKKMSVGNLNKFLKGYDDNTKEFEKTLVELIKEMYDQFEATNREASSRYIMVIASLSTMINSIQILIDNQNQFTNEEINQSLNQIVEEYESLRELFMEENLQSIRNLKLRNVLRRLQNAKEQIEKMYVLKQEKNARDFEQIKKEFKDRVKRNLNEGLDPFAFYNDNSNKLLIY